MKKALNHARINLLGVPVDPVSKDAMLNSIEDNLREKRSSEFYLAVNPIKVIKAPSNAEFMSYVNTATCYFPDAIGIVWALRLLHGIQVSRVPGFELMFDILAIADKLKLKVGLVGSHPRSLEKAEQVLSAKHRNVRFESHHGYFTDEEWPEVVQGIADANPDVLLVGMGTIRQEKFIVDVRNRINVPVCMSVGGSFDVISEVSPRAPQWLCRLGFEWLYRLFRQPKRWRAMLPLPVFAVRVLGAFVKGKFSR